jgi:glycerol-3-phosphate cytidylyltransferase
VGLLSDPTISRGAEKNKPVQSMFERWCQLQATSYVDLIIPFETEEEIIEIVKIIQPDIRIVGEEYKEKKFTGDYLCDIHYNRRRHGFSTTELRERIRNG